MSYLILQSEPKRVSAYSISLLAGCAGFATDDDFLDACCSDDSLLSSTARQVDPFMSEEGDEAVAETTIRQRLRAIHADIVEAPLSANDKKFEDLLRAGQGAVLVQASRLEGIRKGMTTAAIVLATTVGLALSAAAPQAHAGGIDQFAKDTIGGVIGAAIGGNFGQGRGRVAMQVLGAAAGIAIAESLQRQQQAANNGAGVPGYGQANNQNQVGTVAGGSEQLSPDKRDKMMHLERNALASRDAFAKSLAVAQQAEDNRMLDPRDRNAYQSSLAASTATQTYNQAYSQARSDFVNAFEYLAKRGYDVHEFSYSYAMAQRQVTAKDVNYRDMQAAAAPVYSSEQPRAAVLNGPQY